LGQSNAQKRLFDRPGLSTFLEHDALPPPTLTKTNPPFGRLSPLPTRDMVQIPNESGGDGAATFPLHPERRGIAQTMAVAAAGTTNP